MTGENHYSYYSHTSHNRPSLRSKTAAETPLSDEQVVGGVVGLTEVVAYPCVFDAVDELFLLDAHDVHGHGARDEMDAGGFGLLYELALGQINAISLPQRPRHFAAENPLIP